MNVALITGVILLVCLADMRGKLYCHAVFISLHLKTVRLLFFVVC